MGKKKINYWVIGGQYEHYNYGGTHTLLGAKRLARKNQEYWDNWQGWHTPSIWADEDCEYQTTQFGRSGIFPIVDRKPAAFYRDGWVAPSQLW